MLTELDGALYVGTVGHGVFRRDPKVGHWRRVAAAWPTNVYRGMWARTIHGVWRAETLCGPSVYLKGRGGRIFRLDVEQRRWLPVSDGPSLLNTGHGQWRSNGRIDVMTASEASVHVMARGANVFWREHGGDTWRQHTPAGQHHECESLTAFDGNLYAVLSDSEDGHEHRYRTSRSINQGRTWNVWRDVHGHVPAPFYDLLPHRSSLLALSESGVFRLQVKRGQWLPVSNGLTEPYVTVLTASDSTLYAGTWSGLVFRSVDEGDSWTQV